MCKHPESSGWIVPVTKPYASGEKDDESVNRKISKVYWRDFVSYVTTGPITSQTESQSWEWGLDEFYGRGKTVDPRSLKRVFVFFLWNKDLETEEIGGEWFEHFNEFSKWLPSRDLVRVS